MVALHFFSVNLVNFSPHLLLLSTPLNCPQSRSNFLTLIWLYIISSSIFLEISVSCIFLTVSRRLSDSHIICINYSSRISHHRRFKLSCWWSHWLQINAIQFLSLLDHANLTQYVSFPTHRHSHTLNPIIMSANFTLSVTVIYLPISTTDYFQIIYPLTNTTSPTAPNQMPHSSFHTWNLIRLPDRPWWRHDHGTKGPKRANSRPTNFRAITEPEVGRSEKIRRYTSNDLAYALMEKESRKWIRLFHRWRDDDVTNLAFCVKNRKSSFSSINNSVSFNCVRGFNLSRRPWRYGMAHQISEKHHVKQISVFEQ